MTERKIGLDDAYGLKTPEDSVRLYRDWAGSYDSEFAAGMDYRLPAAVARAFTDAAGGRDAPVLDAGAGTGLVGEHLEGYALDALDISEEMLEMAAAKGLYRKTIAGDLTGTLPIADESFGGVVSAGTFTHGHVGPEALGELLRVARPDALFVLAINAEAFIAQGFGAALEVLGPALVDLVYFETAIYGPRADPAHRGDRALIARFRKG
ncbi:hypothetical protein DDZ14_09755 [Maritimibacter sp. 55A14]|uniref:class I SAM-dependent DNA methyltransferase n=1 Tax=Maritimibacter sp. 55A14 TaxID=2174844 RepID=UPI000D61C254|nr:class I SAM-dependent methyltransferase [Maritimibacter sp. 55A14]PWE32665.1 hypothetical protein DDZ14_09755 [Maritimibacter sp. 55A14]